MFLSTAMDVTVRRAAGVEGQGVVTLPPSGSAPMISTRSLPQLAAARPSQHPIPQRTASGRAVRMRQTYRLVQTHDIFFGRDEGCTLQLWHVTMDFATDDQGSHHRTAPLYRSPLTSRRRAASRSS